MSTNELCAPAGLTAAEQCEYWRELAEEQHAALVRAEAALIGDNHDRLQVWPHVCAAIAKAEGRS